jgi:hypothetical protein
MKLTSENVNNIMLDSLFKEGEDESNGVHAEGIIVRYSFHPDRLQSHKEAIKDMLSQLPDPFMKDSGGGWSFLNACQDKSGTLWGQHRDMEALVCLGIACGMAHFQMPREMWSIFPGGMPYFEVNLNN